MKAHSIIYLCLAIISEVIATSFLKNSNNFKNIIPSLIVVIGYISAFYFLSLSLKTIPLGVAYAIWAGAGTTLLTIIGIIFYKQPLSLTMILGLILTICGLILLNLSIAH